jgi:hypothetical protein
MREILISCNQRGVEQWWTVGFEVTEETEFSTEWVEGGVMYNVYPVDDSYLVAIDYTTHKPVKVWTEMEVMVLWLKAKFETTVRWI